MIVFEIIGAICLFVGTIICIIGGIGLIRMKSFFGRVHAASVPDTLGAGLCLLGMVLFTVGLEDPMYTWDLKALIIVKLVSIGVFIFFTSPIAGHAVSKAAWNNGIGKDESMKAFMQEEVAEHEAKTAEAEESK